MDGNADEKDVLACFGVCVCDAREEEARVRRKVSTDCRRGTERECVCVCLSVCLCVCRPMHSSS
jgi:hypothetical protein